MAERLSDAHRRLRRWIAAAVAFLAVAPAPAMASDATAPVNLEWLAPEECPDGAYVEHEVARVLGEESQAAGVYLQAHAFVQKEKGGLWHIDLRTTGPQGSGFRTVTAESCTALADAAALILALAISPERVALKSSGASSPAPPAPAPALREPIAREREGPAPGPRPPRRPLAQFAAEASAVVDMGTLPATAPGVALRFAMVPRVLPRLRLELGAAYFLDEATTDPATRSGTFSLRSFDAAGCFLTPWRHVEIGVCVGAEVAWMVAAGLKETSNIYHRDAEWLVLRARGTLAYFWLPAWAFRVDLGGGLDMSRPEFLSDGGDSGLIHQPARFTGRAALGVEVRF